MAKGGEEMKSCDTCFNRSTCTKDIGFIFGGCNVDYEPDQQADKKKPLPRGNVRTAKAQTESNSKPGCRVIVPRPTTEGKR